LPAALSALNYALFDGLNLIPNTVLLPYFSWLEDRVKGAIFHLLPDNTQLLGIDDQAWLLKDSGQWHVKGYGAATLWQHSTPQAVIPAGHRIPSDLLLP
jgi:hypothetical protein